MIAVQRSPGGCAPWMGASCNGHHVEDPRIRGSSSGVPKGVVTALATSSHMIGS